MLSIGTPRVPPIAQPTYSELVRQYLKCTHISALFNAVLAFSVWVFLLSTQEKIAAAWWLCGIGIISFIRLSLVTSRRTQSLNDQTLSIILGSGSIATACLWGALPWVINWQVGSSQHVFIPFLLAGVSAGGMVITSFLLIPACCWMLMVIVPGMLPLLFTGDHVHQVMFGIALVYCLFLMKTCHFLHHTFRKNIELRFEHQHSLTTLQKQHDELETTSEGMLAAKKEAQEANKYKSEFLARMSHEIRTPLNAILGLTSLALDSCKDKEQEGHLRLVQESATSLLTIINDVLDISKIEAGKLSLNETPFLLQTEIQRIQALFQHSASEKLLSLTLEIDPEPLYIKGDSVRLSQVMINLVGNAMKFSGSGSSIHIKACSLRRNDSEVRVLFSVKDTGIGIPAGKQKSIFEAFEQADNSVSRRYGGTGLGLSISGNLVNMMGGKIELESTPGKGSRFWFELSFPLLSPAEIEELTQAVSIETPRPPATESFTRKLTILVAEDNVVNQRVTQRLLESAGHSVILASNGAEAVAYSEKDRFDVILMDCSMPIVDGYEAANLIRKIEHQKQVPIIALTAHAFAGEKARCISAGMDDYLCKPFHRKELLEKIYQRCRGRES